MVTHGLAFILISMVCCEFILTNQRGGQNSFLALNGTAVIIYIVHHCCPVNFAAMSEEHSMNKELSEFDVIETYR